MIVDDVVYFDEPFFARGPIGDAVDDVAAQGVHYFSSAGNGSSQQAYQAPLRIVAPDSHGGQSNINLDGVDPALYAGGFQDFDAGPGTDIAQSMVLGGDPTSDDGGTDGILDLQWDDPVDPNGAPLGDPLISTTGEITAAQPVATSRSTAPRARRSARIVDAIPSGSTDFILTLKDPAGERPAGGRHGHEPGDRRPDAARRPARTRSRSPASTATSATSRSRSSRCSAVTHDDRPQRAVLRRTTATSSAPCRTSTALGQAVRDRRLPRPRAAAARDRQGQHRRGRRDAAALPARTTALRGRPSTSSRWRPSIFGHALGATARPRSRPYDPFRPFAAGGLHVGRRRPADLLRLGRQPAAAPDIRRVPQVAATDGGNTTFFTPDSKLDPDTQPNFFGTSAAAPHAAGDRGARAAGARRADRSPDGDARAAGAQHVHPRPRPLPRAGRRAGGLTITADGEQGARASRLAPGVDDARLDEQPALLHRQLQRAGPARRRSRSTG